ncbi:MAG TPA: MurT ligase domain-containing protein [Pseudolysinimonas sp.]|nr:MurT ligase domain-containing protein [Pseudolysinimonas sp.]
MASTLNLRDLIAVASAGACRFVLRRILRRGGTAIPGLIADRMSPRLLGRALRSLPQGYIAVSGSSGKSTTTRMLAALLRAHGLSVFTNSSTANLRQGVVTAVIDQAGPTGRLHADIGVIELDEAVAPGVAVEVAPRLAVLTNISGEQLDRFHSPHRVAEMLRALAKRAGLVVAGRDDPLLRELTGHLSGVRWFGAGGDSAAGGRGTAVQRSDGRDAVLLRAGVEFPVRLPSRGDHYALDAAAALEAAAVILGTRLDPATVERTFDELTPVFGRGELRDVGGQPVEFVLVQNPDSLRRNLALLDPVPDQLMVAIGSDVRDTSWLWSVDTAALRHVDVVTGSRAFEIGARLAYDGVELDLVTDDLEGALERFLALPQPASGVKTVVFSADAMRRIRRRLGHDRIAA